MTRATITTELDFEGFSIEVDGEYWRYEDEQVTDLTLVYLWVHEPDETGNTKAFDLLRNLDKDARLQVERNLFAVPGVVERLAQDIAAQGEDLHIEPDYDPHTEED
tara:strand:+ start:563 stop:880 length:318 start_codon:yes stop_codon:yes gene_type:complete